MAEQIFNLQVITPMGLFYKNPVQRIIVTTTEGEMGILALHEPITTILAIGTIEILDDQGQSRTAVVTGGFMIVSDEEGARIFGDTAEWPEDIDLNRALAAKERAEKRLKEKRSDINITRAEIALRKALIRIQTGEKFRR